MNGDQKKIIVLQILWLSNSEYVGVLSQNLSRGYSGNGKEWKGCCHLEAPQVTWPVRIPGSLGSPPRGPSHRLPGSCDKQLIPQGKQ